MDIKSEETNGDHSNAEAGIVWFPMGSETMMDIENRVLQQSCASNIAAGLQDENLKPEDPQSSGQFINANIKEEMYDVKDESFVDEAKIPESPAKGNCEAKEVYDVKDESFVDEAKSRESPAKGNCEATWKWRPNMYKEIMPILDSEEKCKTASESLEKASKTHSFQSKIEATASTLEEELFGPLSPLSVDSDEDSECKMGQEEEKILNHIDFEDLDVKPTLSDFDIMRQKSNASRKRAPTLPFNHYASKVDKFIQKMRVAAETDRELNKRKEPAYKKVKLLKQFMKMLNNQNLKHLFYEFDVYEVLAEWLAPLPSGAWPCFHMRHSILQAMHLLPTIDLVTLKGHQIAKKVMFYWKHPNEERENRELAKQLIHKWARSYYSIPDDIGSMSVAERRERDVFIKTKLIVGSKEYKDIEKSFDFNRFAELHTPVDTGEPVNSQKSSAIGDVINLADCTDIGEAVKLDKSEDGFSIISVKSLNCEMSSIFGDGASLAKSEALSPFVEPSTGSETPSNPEKASRKRRVTPDDPIGRARVPEPSTKAYFIRPQSQVTTPFSNKPKKKVRRFNNRLVL